MTEIVDLPTYAFRPGSQTNIRVCNFVVKNGGLGDFIGMSSALVWIARTQPHVRGRVWVYPFFRPIAENIFAPFDGWEVLDMSDFNEERECQTYQTAIPTIRPINTQGCHPVDYGFIQYCTLNPPPEDGNFYPVLDLNCVRTQVFPDRFAVLTPGATIESRMLPPRAFNRVKDFLISKGVTPVLLGKKEVSKQVRPVMFSDLYNFDGCINLIDQTSLLEAAKIMSYARIVVGLDNGLLHLAAMTEVPIVFGYNVASPEHRRPRRKKGVIAEISPEQSELPCVFCQSRMRYTFGHDFNYCIYGDLKCLQLLSDPGPWCEAIEGVLGC